MPRFPRTISCRRTKETPSRAANADCEMRSGFRNSISSISPGCVGGRCVGSRRLTSASAAKRRLVVVCDLDVRGISILPAEADSILAVDPNAVLAKPVALKRFQSVAWRVPQLLDPPDTSKLVQLSSRNGPQARRASSPRRAGVPAVKDVLRAGVRKGVYHGRSYNATRYNRDTESPPSVPS